MGNVTVYLHKSIQDYADLLSSAMDTSRSEVVEDMIRYVKDNELEKEVWGSDLEDILEGVEEESEEGEEEESDEEED